MESVDDKLEMIIRLPQKEPQLLERNVTGKIREGLDEIKRDLANLGGVSRVEIRENSLAPSLDNNIFSDHLFVVRMKEQPIKERVLILKDCFIQKAKETGLDGLALQIIYQDHYFDPHL